MLNTLRIKSMWGARLKGALAAMLLAGSGAALAAPVTVNLCAKAGSVTMPALPSAINVAVYGYVAGPCSGSAAVVAPGGPVIDVTVGDVVTVNLENSLPTATGLLFQGQAMVPDTTGACGRRRNEDLHVHGQQARHVPVRSSTAAQCRAPDGDGSVRRTDRAAGPAASGLMSATRHKWISRSSSDTAILASDLGAPVSGVGIPVGATITAVTPGVSFTMSGVADVDGTQAIVTLAAMPTTMRPPRSTATRCWFSARSIPR